MIVVTLKHKQPVILEGIRGYVVTSAGFYSEMGYNAEEVKAAVDNENNQRGYRLNAYILSRGACICSDKGHYERVNAEFENAPILYNGDIVSIDGVEYQIVYKGHCSDMGVLYLIEDVKKS